MAVRPAGLFALCAATAAVPLFASDIQLFVLAQVLILAIALLGLNILVGYNGQISLGHGAFYAIGAYAAAIAVTHSGVPHWAAVPLAAAVSLVAGIGFGLPLLRLGGVHLAMATFALGAVLPLMAKHKSIEAWTGGAQGLSLDLPAVPFGLALSFDQWMYLLCLLVLLVSMFIAVNLLGGRVGRALMAIRDHPIAAEAAGIHGTRYKAAAFGVSAMFTGTAGALAALSLQYVAPGLYGAFLSFTLLIGVAVGGLGSLGGAIYGALFLQVVALGVGLTARTLDSGNVFIIYGAAVLLVVRFMPQGVASVVARVAARLRPAVDFRKRG